MFIFYRILKIQNFIDYCVIQGPSGPGQKKKKIE